MRLKTQLFVLILVLSLVSVSAIEMETLIKVNTAPNFNVTVAIKDTNDYYHFQTEDSGKEGFVKIFFEVETLEYELSTISIKREPDTEPAYFVRFDETYQAGQTQEIDFYPKWSPKPLSENDTLNTTNETSTLETNNSSEDLNETLNETVEQSPEKLNPEHKVTAFSITGGVISVSGRILYYVGGIVVLIIFLVFFIKWEKNRPKKEKKIKITKLSEIHEAKTEDIKKQEERIAEAKRMIQEAETEIKKIRNPNMNKIEQAKRKLIEDQRELMKLREEAKNIEEEKNKE
jgi:hypothetical protein